MSNPTPPWVQETLHRGIVIPAHPLALTRDRKLDERRQRALTRYYHAAGSGGIAVGVHTTQFEIRLPRHGLFQPVLELAARTAKACDAASGCQTIRIAGICGPTPQAVAEASLARDLDYHLGLLSLGGMTHLDEDGLIEHCKTVANEIPLMGFYLQPAVGGHLLSVSFWRRFVSIENVAAIKIAPFNRYQTLDVIRAVAETGRAGSIALYTGNDDAIVQDLLARHEMEGPTGPVRLGFSGGLLGHWACWTRHAVKLLAECQHHRTQESIPSSLLTLAGQITDCNGAFFDTAHAFAGCIPGIHEVLRRQGLLDNLLCLDPSATLSPGQSSEITRVQRAYPDLNDDAFVREHLDEWLAD
ncbi:MAG: dihydrodipicolinate synthase family protein [Verrucomicrobia bacterium]|jgi:fermentation-respiration switch protein FrsA (DUF1100 family)|nr:dihydrodipicolinate synthase family protein [Verrucomicrobiota bacterium]